MLATTHRLTGAAAGLAVATAASADPARTLVTVAVAAVTAAGATSPDIDLRGSWRLVDKVLPDEWLGHGGPFRHRGLAHWWGLPVAAWWASSLLPAAWRWLAVAALVGWASHLVGDFVFGQANRRQGRGPGVPLAPWWWHIGIGLDTGGILEQGVRWFVLPGVIAWQLATLAAAQGWLDIG